MGVGKDRGKKTFLLVYEKRCSKKERVYFKWLREEFLSHQSFNIYLGDAY